MTQSEKRVRILEWQGWTELSTAGRRGADGPVIVMRGTNPSGEKNQIPPNHFTNLNAMAEAENRLHTSSLQQTYAELLQKQIRWICYASASQRAEAFGLTLNLWT